MPPEAWPRCPVIYEIYPRSFRDTTGSGTGDLGGILEKIDYIAELGVDAVWIAPFYPSPLKDGGYDIIDLCEVDPAMGDIHLVARIIDAVHERGLKVLTDQVLNHTSDRSTWFEKSANRREGYDDWYVWRDAKPDGTAPNNWMSYFGPPAWTWDHRREQYYWHQFLSHQPNLNLRNPSVQKALEEQMQFWRDMGVDGFRMDAITAYLHDESFADNPVASPEVKALVAGPSFSPYSWQDHEFDLLPGDGAAFCENVRSWAGKDAYLLGEINVGNQSVEIANEFTRSGRLDAAYTIDFAERGFTPQVIADVLDRMARNDDQSGGRFVMWLSSHDQPRQVTSFGDGSRSDAKFLAMACGTLPGPWLIFQGEELGLPQPSLSREENTDPFDLNFWPDGATREGGRVPIPWNDKAPGYGFTDGGPWLPMRWQSGMSVQSQQADETSVLAFYRDYLRFRRDMRLVEGTFETMQVRETLLTLRISTTKGSFVCAMNFGTESEPIPLAKGAPLFASRSGVKTDLPGRTVAIWRLD